MPLCYPQELWRNQGQLGIVLMRLSRGQNKVPHQGPAFCYQHCCPTLIWAAGGTGWRICQWSGKGDVDTWLLLIRTWTHSAHHAASRWWLYKAHKPCSFVTRLFSSRGAIRNTYSQTSLVGGTSLYFHMWLLSAGWNLDKLHSQPGWLYWNPAEEKSGAAKPPFCFTLPGRGQLHSASGPNLFPNCISDPYGFHPKVSSYSVWWGMFCFGDTMLSLWSASPAQSKRPIVPTECEKGLEIFEMETAFKSKSFKAWMQTDATYNNRLWKTLFLHTFAKKKKKKKSKSNPSIPRWAAVIP